MILQVPLTSSDSFPTAQLNPKVQVKGMRRKKPPKNTDHLILWKTYMDVSKNNGTPKSSILKGFSIIFTIHFGVPPFKETPISYLYK